MRFEQVDLMILKQQAKEGKLPESFWDTCFVVFHHFDQCFTACPSTSREHGIYFQEYRSTGPRPILLLEEVQELHRISFRRLGDNQGSSSAWKSCCHPDSGCSNPKNHWNAPDES